MTREEKVAKAQRLRGEGLKLREIAEQMGSKIQTVHSWLSDPDLSQQRARRKRYAGTCEVCGAATDGSQGPGNAPIRCIDCRDIETQERDEQIVAMWNAGESAAAIGEKFDLGPLDVNAIIQRRRRTSFLPVPPVRRHLPHKATSERREQIAAWIWEGFSNREIAERLNTSEASVNQMICSARRAGFDMPYRSELAA